MKRRSFVKSSLLLSFLTSIIPAETKAGAKKSREEFYELRVYNIKNDAQEKIIDNYFQAAAIPALNKLGSKNVGIFKELKPEGQTKIFVLIPFATLDDFLKVDEKLFKDAVYQQSGAAYLTAPATAP